MLLFDDLIFHMVTQLLLIDLFELAIDMTGKDWSAAEECLNTSSKDGDRVWGLRFYILLTECYKEWGQFLKPTNKDGSDSIFKRMHSDLAVKVPICPLDLYYYADVEKLEIKDADFAKWKQSSVSKPSNIFHQKLDTLVDKENVGGGNLGPKRVEVKNALLSGNSPDRKMRSRGELSNLVESLRHIDANTSMANKSNSFEKMFESIKLDRKLLMHELFRNKIIVQRINHSRQKYQDSVILNYDKIEDFLKINSTSAKETQDNLLKELEFANWLFDFMDNNFNANPGARINQLRQQICKTFDRIHGTHPRFYDQFTDKPAQVFQTEAESEKSEGHHSDNKYINRDHSIQMKRTADNSLSQDTSLNRYNNKVYSFSKDANDQNSAQKTNRFGDDFANEYGHMPLKTDLLSMNNQYSHNTTVRTFLKGTAEQEKAMIKGVNTQKTNGKEPSPYDALFANVKNIPVVTANTFKSYDEAIEARHNDSLNGSKIREMVRTRSRRASRDSLNNSKGSIKISFDKPVGKPGNMRDTRMVDHRDEYGRDSSHKKLTSNAKGLDNSLNRASSLDIRPYSNNDTLQSLKKRNPRLSSSVFNKNGVSIQKMDDLLIQKKMNHLEIENKSLVAKRRKLERELSDMSIRERSISKNADEPLSKTKRTLKTITDFNNHTTIGANPNKQKISLNLLIEEFNKKNEAHAALKAKYAELTQKFSQKAVDSISINMKKSERMRDTVYRECMALGGNGDPREALESLGGGLSSRRASENRWIGFDTN